MEENNPVPKATILDDAVTVHRIGGGATENLVLKSREETLNPPGISVLEAAEPQSVAFQMRTAFPKATVLHELSRTIGSAKVGDIRSVGFDVIQDRTKQFPNHCRLIHPLGVAGFSAENLQRLSAQFTNITVP